jgi:glyoxylase I family protein
MFPPVASILVGGKLDAMTFRVERIDHVVLRVRNLPAMVRFYEQALGFVVERRLDRLNLVQMRAGASMLDLIEKERPAEGGNLDHVCFRIEPFDRQAIESRLSSLGIAVGETVERYGAEGTGPSIYFHDPEGNEIELKGASSQPSQ